MKLMRFVFCLFFLIMLASLSFASEGVIDLGETGFSCSRDFKKNEKGFLVTGKNGVYLNPINLSYKTKLAKHTGTPQIKHFSFKKNFIIPIGTKIFVFSCYDEESAEFAKSLDFDYGLCIEYKSMDDIRDFKERVGIGKPVQIANDEIVSSLGISSYPALITIKKDELEIQEGF